MSRYQPIADIARQSARVVPNQQDAVAAPKTTPQRGQRAWELHPAIHVMFASSFGLFLLLLASAAADPGLVLPMAICAVTIGMFFAVPAFIGQTIAKPEGRLQSWKEFLREPFDTLTGPLGGKAVMAQILTLPAVIVAWALFVNLYWHVLGQ